MALTPAAYIPTMDRFMAHWGSANAALGGGGPIVLVGAESLATFTTLRTQLETARAQVEAERNGKESARAQLEIKKAALLDRLNQFNNKVASLSPGPAWESLLPKAFGQSDGFGKVVPALDDLADVWRRYDEDTSGMVLIGGYDRPDFLADLTALKTAYGAINSADNSLSQIRGQRSALEARAYAAMKAYRKRIPAEFLAGSPILMTLPILTPEYNRTPVAVNASGNWNAATMKADLTWTASTDADLDHYEVRGVAGPEWDAEDEEPVATVPGSGPIVLSTPFALLTPGNSATYKIFTVLTSGAERGSNPVTVTRPV